MGSQGGWHANSPHGPAGRSPGKWSGSSVRPPAASAYRLLPRLGENLNVAVLLAGGNDMLTRRTPEQWRDDLATILDDLINRIEQVAVTGVPPFAAFPSLPTTLGRYLAQRAGALDAVSQEICAEQPRTTWISSTDILPIGPDFFAQDRFHPSAAGYRRWARAVADHLA